MSNANNFLQNLGMMQPMFAAANPQQQSGDDAIDLHDIFADYFNEDPTGAQLSGAFAAAQQQPPLGGQGVSLPTGAGIRTAWHAGSLPAMQQQQQQQGAVAEPAAKRARGEDLYLPGQQQQAYGANTGVTQQQQMALAQAASGVGALSNRLGFNVQSNNGAGQMMGQQQSQGVLPTQQQAAAAAGMVNLPVGMGMKFGAGGNIVPPAGAPGVANGVGGGIKTGLVNNVASVAQQHLANRVAVSNTQYGISPGMGLMTKANVEDQMAAERRLRNREHAKRSRVRKKFMVESLQQQVRGLQDENSTLRLLVQKHIPQNALQIIDECCSKSVLFATGDTANNAAAKAPQDASKKGAETPLLRSDFSLIESLTSGQQNFVLSDPRLPDNPIVFASPGFFELTGYTREQVLGRNCRFLQGAGTDRKSIDVIRTAVANGTDATVCLLNYKADGTPFWNQLFVAALRDADNCIVNYVGVQTMIEPNAGATALEDKVNAAHPITVGVEDEGKGGKE